ncbi:MAG: hypothetical protein JO332_00490 [Planctomycetaceae bacterium]|nr:hypothetical protein [Planctomycetaceae bacterium]
MARLRTLPAILLIVGCQGPAPTPVPDARLTDAAASYATYGRVDDEKRWAPWLCREPRKSVLRTSASRDEATHGRKQYYLYARDRNAYVRASDAGQPEGQVVVKESWIQQEKGPLFIMMKRDGDWIYATATPDGREITASGKLASCRECHESDRTRDRVFGLAESE